MKTIWFTHIKVNWWLCVHLCVDVCGVHKSDRNLIMRIRMLYLYAYVFRTIPLASIALCNLYREGDIVRVMALEPPLLPLSLLKLSSHPVCSRGWIERLSVCVAAFDPLLCNIYKPFSFTTTISTPIVYPPFEPINRFSVHFTEGTSCNRFILLQFRDFRWI